jgi:protein involved in polysaccharide export with SLBB domain
VYGCVKQPGQYAVSESEHLTVAGLIAKAHGLTDEAGSVATVYRIANGKARIIKIDLYAVLNDPKADVELFAGDRLSVRELPELLPKLIALCAS